MRLYCQSPTCKHDFVADSGPCPKCGSSVDDWPVDADMGGVQDEESQYYEDLNKWYALDRA